MQHRVEEIKNIYRNFCIDLSSGDFYLVSAGPLIKDEGGGLP